MPSTMERGPRPRESWSHHWLKRSLPIDRLPTPTPGFRAYRNLRRGPASPIKQIRPKTSGNASWIEIAYRAVLEPAGSRTRKPPASEQPASRDLAPLPALERQSIEDHVLGVGAF